MIAKRLWRQGVNQPASGCRIRMAVARRIGTVSLCLLLGPTLLHGRAELSASQGDSVAARTAFESWAERWRQGGLEVRGGAVASSLHDLLDLDQMARSALGDEWKRQSPERQAALTDALGESVRRLLLRAGGGEGDSVTVPALEWAGAAQRGNREVLSYRLRTAGGGAETLVLELAESAPGQWKIQNVVLGRQDMERYFRERVPKLLKDYSLPYLVAVLTDADRVVLEDFQSSTPGALPEGWTWKGSDDRQVKPYAIREDPDGNRYLAATDSGQSVILGKDVPWDLDQYPYVSFRVRVNRIPAGGDERDDRKVDSAAGIYFIYRKRMGLIPESVKYVWSSTLPVGAAVQRHGTGRPWMVVIGSGTDHLGEWRTYRFDLRQAYKDTFGKNPPEKMLGIGLLSDANSTTSEAFADYDDLSALRRVDGEVGSGITRILQPVR